ncbi:related to Glucose oxidase [Ustilago sp. UG-2017a]|nr:related to Glucose oxidase [Ustilago sp. UG-2017a]
MKSPSAATTLILLATSTALSATIPAPPPSIDYTLFKRTLLASPTRLVNASYDYIIVGGGLSGLVLANRLSSNASISVAVIEAGSSGYSTDRKLLVPSANLYDSSVGTEYDWQFTTSPQPGLSGRSAPWPRGKVLGGSSAINGLYYVRHSEIEQDVWAGLIGEGEGERWRWASMLEAMKKSEVFTPPNQATIRATGVEWDQDSHGTDGPVHVSFPQRTYPQVAAFLHSAESVGIESNANPHAGQSWGAFLATSNINPTNSTRSFSRTAYLDPVVERSNLDVLTGHLVTKVIFNSTTQGDAVASGVQFAANPGATEQTVYASKEVILAGGAVNDPQILQLSGIADASLLSNLGIPLVVDLPGVGYHLQDHLSTGVVFSPSAGSEMPPTRVTGDAVTDSYVNSAIAYVPPSTLFNQSEWNSIIDQIRSAREASIEAYNAPSVVKAGYNATYTAQVEQFFPSPIGPIELLFALSFGGMQVQAALQHPLSRGSIIINSTNPFAPPTIDPAYLSNPADMTILRQGFKLARRLATTPPLSNFTSSETTPGTAVSSDAQWEEWIRSAVGTEFHPSSTCCMLPREQGGVVDSNLRVYGTRNVRVVDASVPPLSFSAHLMSVTYGLAELGAELVLQDYMRGMQGFERNTSAVRGGGGGGDGGRSARGGEVGAGTTLNGRAARIATIASVVLSLLLGSASLLL